MKVKELYAKLEESFPKELSCEWDHDGLQVCNDETSDVQLVLLTLDITEEAIQFAISNGANVILSHHPILFIPREEIAPDSKKAELLKLLSENNISTMSFHTRADAAIGGVSDLLAKAIGLQNVKVLGEENILRMGELKESTSPLDFAHFLKNTLGSPVVHFVSANKDIQTVIVCGGEGKDFIPYICSLPIDAYVCGKMSYHTMQDGMEAGKSMYETGHFFSERLILNKFNEIISPFVKTIIFNKCPIQTI